MNEITQTELAFRKRNEVRSLLMMVLHSMETLPPALQELVDQDRAATHALRTALVIEQATNEAVS